MVSQSVSPYHQRQIQTTSKIIIICKVQTLPQVSHKSLWKKLVFKVPQILKSPNLWEILNSPPIIITSSSINITVFYPFPSLRDLKIQLWTLRQPIKTAAIKSKKCRLLKQVWECHCFLKVEIQWYKTLVRSKETVSSWHGNYPIIYYCY